MIIGSSNSALNVEKSGGKVKLKTGRDLTKRANVVLKQQDNKKK